MTDQQQSPQNDDSGYIAQLRDEASSLSPEERAEHEALVDELAGELALAETIQAQAMADIEAAKSMAISFTRENGSSKEKEAIRLPGNKIGWLPSDDTLSVDLQEIGSEDESIFFGSIVGKDKIASKAFRRLEAQGEATGLLTSLKQDGLPKLWKQIQTGDSQARPISIGNRNKKEVKASKSLNTVYPAYKLDVHGTNNRAIVLLANKQEGKPIFVLAALYDHEDQGSILSHMFLKPSRRK